MPIVLEGAPSASGSGVPGLDAFHTWNGSLILNDDKATPFAFRLTKIGGWRSLPDTGDIAEAADSRSGEIPRAVKRLGKTVAYEGRIVAERPGDLHAGLDTLIAAFQSTEPDGQMVVTPFTLSSGPSFFYNARALTLVSDEEWIRGPQDTPSGGWERAFVLSFRLHDPRFFLTTETFFQSDTFTPTPTGMPWSWTVGTDGSWNPGAVSRAVSNSGLLSADPVITLYNGVGASGNVVAPRIANGATQTGLRTSTSIIVHPGEYIEFDFRQRTVKQGGSDIDWGRVADYSDWWDDGVPGLINATQPIYAGGKSLSTNTYFTVRFNEARY